MWELVKKLAIVTGIILSVLKLYDWIPTPRAELVAEVTYNAYEIPKGLTELIKELRNISDRDSIKVAAGLPHVKMVFLESVVDTPWQRSSYLFDSRTRSSIATVIQYQNEKVLVGHLLCL